MALHASVLSVFARNRDVVTSTIDAAGVQRGFTVVQQGVLDICSGIPTVYGTTCNTVSNDLATFTPASTPSTQCVEGLTWLENYLLNSKSEEVVYLVWESWLVVISIVALLDESIPNLIVVLAAQIVNTSWISYRIASDVLAKHIYEEIIVDGICGSFDILGGSWPYDMYYAALVFSITALLAMCFFAFKLVKLYSKAKLASVGSPPVITQILKWRLWMRVFLQFASFFVLASASLWYDKRKGVTVASYYSTNALNDAGFCIVAIISWPWLLLGIHAVSKENRLLFLVYAILSVVLLVISGLWFGSALFLYEYGAWHTFAWVTTLGDVLLVITCILSVICRLNFGRGLAQFLLVEHELQASGFACDTFQDGPSRFGVGVIPAVAPDHPNRLSQRVFDPFRSSFNRLKHAPSVCSVESAVFASWLSSKDSRDPEKCTRHIARDRLPSVIIISAENMRSCATASVSDSEHSDEVDEKKPTVS
ncbi:hypothetical protein V8E55_009596 [Tylopilus felleus]